LTFERLALSLSSSKKHKGKENILNLKAVQVKQFNKQNKIIELFDIQKNPNQKL